MLAGNRTRLLSWLMFGTAVSLSVHVSSDIGHQITKQHALSDSWNQAHPSIPVVEPGRTVEHRPRLAEGVPLAKISVPSITYSGIVLEGTSNQVLSGGPGHLVGTAYPGESDNVVISNPNSYSQQWSGLRQGQTIDLVADYGSFTYRVTGFRVADANDASVTTLSGRPMLTFTTCWPLWAGALATERYVISAEMQN